MLEIGVIESIFTRFASNRGANHKRIMVLTGRKFSDWAFFLSAQQQNMLVGKNKYLPGSGARDLRIRVRSCRDHLPLVKPSRSQSGRQISL